MPISPLPTPPSTSDPANFDERADEFLGALPDFQAEANALAADVTAKEASTTAAVGAALAAGLADAADNATATAADRVQTGLDRTAASNSATAAAASAASAEAIVGFPAPTGADVGKFYGIGAGPTVQLLPAGVRMVTEYLTSGTTWNAPANLIGGRVKYRLQGPGGGGGWTASVAFGSGGGPGGYCEGVAAVTAGSPYTYAIGAGGAVASGSAGSAGGSTTMFGATAGGGGGGPSGASTVPAQLGGSASGADYNQPGPNTASASGNPLLIVPSGTVRFGAYGGATGTGAGTTFDSTGYGVGGRPGNQSNSGQAGRPGLIILEYLVSI